MIALKHWLGYASVPFLVLFIITVYALADVCEWIEERIHD